MKSILEELRKIIKEEGGVSAGGTSVGGTSVGGTSASLGASPTPAMGQVTVNGKPWTSGKSYPAKKKSNKARKSKKVNEGAGAAVTIYFDHDPHYNYNINADLTIKEGENRLYLKNILIADYYHGAHAYDGGYIQFDENIMKEAFVNDYNEYSRNTDDPTITVNDIESVYFSGYDSIYPIVFGSGWIRSKCEYGTVLDWSDESYLPVIEICAVVNGEELFTVTECNGEYHPSDEACEIISDPEMAERDEYGYDEDDLDESLSIEENLSNVKIIEKELDEDGNLIDLDFEIVYNGDIYYVECYAVDLDQTDDYVIHVYKTEARQLSDETEVAKGYMDSTGGSTYGDELTFYDYENDYSELISEIENIIMDNMEEVSLPEAFSENNEGVYDPLFTVNMGNDFLAGADVYQFSAGEHPLFEVLFTAKDEEELIPIYIAGGIMYDDGEWNTYPLPTSAIYEMRDPEKRNEILDKWNQSRTESLVFDDLVQEIADKIKQLPKEQNEAYGDWAGKGIYNPSTIMKAYELEQSWLNSLGLGENEQAPQIMLFVSDDGKTIKNTKFIDRNDIETYKLADNEYFLDMTRDSGDIITDFNLEPVSKLKYQWGFSESKSDVVTRLKKVLEDVDTNKLFPLDDSIAEIENKLMRIRAQIKKDPENTELVQKRDKLEKRLQSAQKRRDKLMNESTMNEISDELASRAVAKRVQLKKQDSDALDKQVTNIVNLQNRDFPRVSGELTRAQDEYRANLDDHVNNPKSNRNKTNRLFRTVAKRAQRLNRKDEYGSYFNRLRRKGEKQLGESVITRLHRILEDEKYEVEIWTAVDPVSESAETDRESLDNIWIVKEFTNDRESEDGFSYNEYTKAGLIDTINLAGEVVVDFEPLSNNITNEEVIDNLKYLGTDAEVVRIRPAYDYDLEESLWKNSILESNSTALKNKLNTAIKKFFNDGPDAFEYAYVDVTKEEDGVRVEVRAELNYSGMDKLSDALNPIIQKYDKYAYFEQDQPGIIIAFIENKKLAESTDDEKYEVEIWTALDPESADGFTSQRINHKEFDTPEEANEWAKAQIQQGSNKLYYSVIQGDKIIADSRKAQNEAMDMTVDYDAVENALTKHLNKLGFKPVEGENAFVYENDEGNYTHQIAYYKQPAEILYTIYNDEDGKIFENSAEAKNDKDVDRFFKETVYPEFDGHESYNKPVSKMINEEYGPYQDDPRFEEISDQIESGFTSGYGYDYEWGPITINGSPIREVLKTVEVRDYVYREISYPVKDGFDYYAGLNAILGKDTIKNLELNQKDIIDDLITLGFDDGYLNDLLVGNKDEIETWFDYDINFQEDEIEEDDE